MAIRRKSAFSACDVCVQKTDEFFFVLYRPCRTLPLRIKRGKKRRAAARVNQTPARSIRLLQNMIENRVKCSEDNRRDDAAVTIAAALDEAFPHLHRRLSGEGQHKNTGRIDVMTCEQIVDVFGKDERLAAPRACQYKAGPFEVTDRFPLLFVAGKK